MADRIKGITIEIGGDTTGLDKALSGTNKEIRNTQSQLKDVERLLKLDPSNTELLKQKQQLLADAVGETKDKLVTLKEAEKQVQQQLAEGKVSQEQYDALKREIIATEQQLESLEDQAGRSNVALQKIEIAGGKVQEFGNKISGVGQELSKVSAGIVAVGTASVAAWNQIDEAYDTIAKGTGATGEALEDLQASFDTVFSSIPTDAATAGSAIADINTRFGFTGEVLEDCTRRFLQYAEVNNTDVSSAIANVSRYMGDAGIEAEKYGEVLDQLTAASQASGLSVDKLSEILTKYGAPMRALGLTTQESIAIFAGWEKAGVNTEIAFSGMKKAIGTWGKAGKDASKEFKKTLDEIAACPDIAAATTKAIEVFGQKAGPDLADAIQGGRFAYEDFLAVVENSEGQLEQTFNDTLDPIDDVKVSMQALTAQAAKLGGAILKTLSPIIQALTDKLERLAEWFGSLNEKQQETVVVVGILIAALGPMLIVIGQITTGIGGLMSMATKLQGVFGLLGASSGPIFLTVAAVTALAAIFTYASKQANEYRVEARKLTEQEQANKEQVDELYESYAALDEIRNQSMETANTEATKNKILLDELQSITDENGNVKDGYEERAQVITGQLAQALGTEITMTGNQIKNYQELCSQLDQLIQKKQANALLEANEGMYAEALTKRSDAFMAYADAKKQVEDTTWALLQAQAEEAKATDEINRLWQENIETGVDVTAASAEWAAKQYEASGRAEGLKEKLVELNQKLSEAETGFVGYNTTIANYEGLSAAIVSGDQTAIEESLLKMINNFETAETGTRESLKRQHDELKAKYEEMKAAVEAGAPGVIQANVDAMGELVKASEAELKRLPDLSKAAGKDTSDQYASGIKENTNLAIAAVVDLIDQSTKDMKELPQLAKVWGADFIDGYIASMKGKTGELAAASAALANTVSSYLHFTRPDQGPLRDYEEWMPHMVQGLADGIRKNIPVIGTASREAAGKIGEELTSGLADGVRKNKKNAKKSAEEIAKAVLDAAQSKLKNHKVYNNMTLAEEADFWDAVRRQVDEGTQARIDADEKYFKAKQDLNKKMQSAEESYTKKVAKAYEDLNKEIKNLNQEYRDAVNSRADEIRSSFGLFEEFSMETDLTSDDLLNNLKSQVNGLNEWRDNLDDLADRGISDDLLEELQELGPKSAAEVKLLTQMTDDELNRYVNLFRQKNRIARKQATEELAPMKDDIAGQIIELKEQTARELAEYQREYMEAMQSLGVALNQPAENLKLAMAQNAVEMVSGLATAIQTEAGSAENTAKFREIADRVLNATGTLPADMQGIGQSTIDQMITGLKSKEEELYQTVQGIARKVTEAMQTALGFQISSTFTGGWNAAGPGVSNQSAAQESFMPEVITLLSNYLPEIAEGKYIALNGKTLVGQTVGDMNRQLSSNLNVRGRVGSCF